MINAVHHHEQNVTIHYTARTREGGIVEDTHSRRPVKINLSESKISPKLIRLLSTMNVGQKQTLLLEPEEIYGLRDNSFQLKIPKRLLPEGATQGDQIAALVDGEEIDVWIVQELDEDVIIDANHPLAGESVEFTVELISREN